MALTEAFGFLSLSASATTYHGAALIAQGRYEEGIAGLRRGISAWRATGAAPHAWHLCYLASGSEKPDGLRKDLRWWKRDWLPSRRPGSRSPVRRYITSKVSCCLRRTRRMSQKRSNVSARRAKSPAGKVRDQKSCVPRRASPGCSRSRAVATKRERCSAKSTAGLLRGSTLAILKEARALLDKLAM